MIFRNFNEFSKYNSQEVKEEIKSFCESYLSFMIDQFNTKVLLFDDNINHYEININTKDIIMWSQIKDEFIPFFYMLCNNYKVTTFYESPKSVIFFGVSSTDYFTKDEILKDKIGKVVVKNITILIDK